MGSPLHPFTVLLVLPVVTQARTGDLVPIVVGMWSVKNSSLVFWDSKKNLLSHLVDAARSFCTWPEAVFLKVGWVYN